MTGWKAAADQFARILWRTDPYHRGQGKSRYFWTEEKIDTDDAEDVEHITFGYRADETGNVGHAVAVIPKELMVAVNELAKVARDPQDAVEALRRFGAQWVA